MTQAQSNSHSQSRETPQDAIVITGIGAVSAHGEGIEPILSALLQEESSAVGAGAENGVPLIRANGWDPVPLLGKKGLQFLRPSTRFVLGASKLALQHAGLPEEASDPQERGVVVASNLAGLHSISNYDWTVITDGPQYVSPMEAPNTLANAPASHLAIRIKSQALNTTMASGQCAGFDAIGYAAKMLRERRASQIVIGGAEELSDQVVWVLRSMGLLSDSRPEDAGRPFDPASSGCIISEGAAALVLERESDALARGAKPLARVLSWHSGFLPASSPERRSAGMAKVCKAALQSAGLAAEQIQLALSGACGLPGIDQVEQQALQQLFHNNPDVIITAPKEKLGESYGAAGIFQAAAAIAAIESGEVKSAYRISQPAGHPAELVRVPACVIPQDGRELHMLLTSQDLFGSVSAVVLQAYGA